MMKKVVNIPFDKFCLIGKWDDELEEYCFPLFDVISEITNTKNPEEYLENITKIEKDKGIEISINSKHQKDGIVVVNPTDLFRIIQIIPSANAEPVKRWLADMGEKRCREEINPDLILLRIIDNYREQGYSDDWIRKKLTSIQEY